MKTYNSNSSIVKKMKRAHKRKYKRYKVCLLLIVAVTLVYIIFSYIFLQYAYAPGEDMSQGILLMSTSFILPFLVILILYCIAVGGGRDIIGSRLNEQILVEDDKFTIQYTPLIRNIENGDKVEKTICFKDISEIKYNQQFERLEMKADYTYTIYFLESLGEGEGNKSVSNMSGDIKIYDYFDSCEELRSEILTKCKH